MMERQRRQPEGVVPRVKNIVSDADHQALQDAYSFLPTARATTDYKSNQQDRNAAAASTWQDRMVQKYHDHLYKEFALADLSQGAGRIGLRWRTQQEVKDGRGEISCGNKHCPKSKDFSSTTLQALSTLEVPFSYQEHGEKTKELVKLRLCSECLPLVATSQQRTAPPATKPAHESRTRDEKARDSLTSDSSVLSRERHQETKKRCKRRKEERSRRKKKRRHKEDCR